MNEKPGQEFSLHTVWSERFRRSDTLIGTSPDLCPQPLPRLCTPDRRVLHLARPSYPQRACGQGASTARRAGRRFRGSLGPGVRRWAPGAAVDGACRCQPYRRTGDRARPTQIRRPREHRRPGLATTVAAEPPIDDWGDGPPPTRRANAPPAGDRMPPQDNAAEQSRARRDAALARTPSPTSSRRSGASTSTGRPTRSIYDAIIDLYGRGEPADAVTVAAELQRRGELAADRRGAVPPHALGQRPDRRQRRLLRRDRAREGDPAPPGRRRHQDRADRLRRRGRGRRHRRPRAGRGLRRHRTPHGRGLRPAVRHHGRRPRRDRGDRQPRRPA